MAPVNFQCFPLDTCRLMSQPVGKYWPRDITMTILSVFVNLHFMPFHVHAVYPDVIPSLVNTKDIHAISFLLFPLLSSFSRDESESERELFFEIL